MTFIEIMRMAKILHEVCCPDKARPWQPETEHTFVHIMDATEILKRWTAEVSA